MYKVAIYICGGRVYNFISWFMSLYQCQCLFYDSITHFLSMLDSAYTFRLCRELFALLPTTIENYTLFLFLFCKIRDILLLNLSLHMLHAFQHNQCISDHMISASKFINYRYRFWFCPKMHIIHSKISITLVEFYHTFKEFYSY